jgi:hypothetical protein
MPVKFEVYRSGQRLQDFQPVAAYIVGPESVPITGEIGFRDGLLTAQRSDEIPMGVSLLWNAGPAGTGQLESTRLLPRPEPYNLNVELARFRLMKIVQKQEDWNLFDFPKAETYLARFKEAQDFLAEALGKLGDPPAAAALADEALARGMQLSEELALFHADLLITRRRSTGGFVKHIFGCRVDTTVQNQKYREMLAGHFDYAVLPTPWKLLQPQEGAFETQAIDSWAEGITKRRLPIIAGPLVNFDESELPDWMFIWENDFETVRELAYEHVQKLVQRYRKAVGLWNVVGGLCTNRAFRLSFEQMIELTRLLVSQVKNVLPNARTLVSVPQPFGEYHARNATSVAPVLYAEMVAQAGINFDGFAVELEIGVPLPGMFMRDLFQISTMLDRFSTLGRPLFITAISAPGRSTPDPEDRSEGRLDPMAAGQWKRPWDPQLQADWLEAVYHVALSKPFVESVAWGNLADINQSVPGGGLLDDMFQPKPAFERYLQIREKFQQWQGRK